MRNFFLFVITIVLCCSPCNAEKLDSDHPIVKSLSANSTGNRMKAVSQLTKLIKGDTKGEQLEDAETILMAAIPTAKISQGGGDSTAVAFARAKLIIALGNHPSAQKPSFLTQAFRMLNDEWQNAIVYEAVKLSVAQAPSSERIKYILDKALTDTRNGINAGASQQILNAIGWRIIPVVLAYLQQTLDSQEIGNIARVFTQVVGEPTARIILEREVEQRAQNQLRAFLEKIVEMDEGITDEEVTDDDDAETSALYEKAMNSEKNLAALLEVIKKDEEKGKVVR